MAQSVATKSVHVRFSEVVHRTAKMKAAALGKTLSEYLAQLITGDKKPRDIIAEALAMPITQDEEELSPETLKILKASSKEPSSGTWEKLEAEIDGNRKKRNARKN